MSSPQEFPIPPPPPPSPNTTLESMTVFDPISYDLYDWVVDRVVVEPNGTNVSVICGLPAFCDATAFHTCKNVTLSGCQVCSMAGAGIFATVVLLLALCILIGNGFLLFCSLLKRDGFTGHYNAVKCSLAVADLITGFQILFITLPHFAWTINMTPTQLDAFQLSLRGSHKANAGGVFYMLGYVASIYHLMFMGFQRLYAILRPLQLKLQKSSNLYLGLALIWVVSILSAAAPLWFNGFVYTYIHIIFLYNLTVRNVIEPINFTPLGVLLVVILGIPYILMTATTIATGLVIHFKIMRRWRSLANSDNETISKQRKERKMFVTLALMQVGFTVTLIPLAVVGILNFTRVLQCNNTPMPYLVCFYLATSNSLVNVLIYSVRDEKFRQAVLDYAMMICRGKKQGIPLKPKDSSGTSAKDSTKINTHNTLVHSTDALGASSTSL